MTSPAPGQRPAAASVLAAAVSASVPIAGDHGIAALKRSALPAVLSSHREVLSPADLVMALLVRGSEAPGTALPVLTIREIPEAVRAVAALGIPAVKLFASGRNQGRARLDGTTDEVMTGAITEAKAAAPGIAVITETCLCAHLDAGECYLTTPEGTPDVTATIDVLASQAVRQAEAGADVVGPAAMIPGTVRAVRAALDGAGYRHVGIMPHLIFDSRLYEEYRTAMRAVPASGRRAFHADPARPGPAVDAGLAFIAEGATSLLLEPALFCTDVLIALAGRTDIPLTPFSVSGEYTLLGSRGRGYPLLAELFTMLRRCGASQVITYAATGLARALAS
jgi:porphobilinogen synthase